MGLTSRTSGCIQPLYTAFFGNVISLYSILRQVLNEVVPDRNIYAGMKHIYLLSNKFKNYLLGLKMFFPKMGSI